MSDIEVVRRALMMRDAGYGEPSHIWEQVGALLKECDRLRALNAEMLAALEIIAGKRQCIDNLMSNQDVALDAIIRAEAAAG